MMHRLSFFMNLCVDQTCIGEGFPEGGHPKKPEMTWSVVSPDMLLIDNIMYFFHYGKSPSCRVLKGF
jgi:hypothetical protein